MDHFWFTELLQSGEGDWLDWKVKLHSGLENRKNASDEDKILGKAKLLKDLAALANSVNTNNTRYLVRGVNDLGASRKIVGVTEHFDDSEFQTWVTNAFDPPIKLEYEEFKPESGKMVGVFKITFDPKGPHVPKQNFGEELREGQVWFRRGTQNRVARRADLDTLIKIDPLICGRFDGTDLQRRVAAHYAPRKLIAKGFERKAEFMAEGYEIAYVPGTRQEIQLMAAPNNPLPSMIILVEPATKDLTKGSSVLVKPQPTDNPFHQFRGLERVGKGKSLGQIKNESAVSRGWSEE
jgi:hypothetical protein